MADKGQSEQQPKDNKFHRPKFVNAFMPKKKKPSSDSQSTPPSGTATAIAWTDETELQPMFTNDDNTPPSGRRMSDHSQLEQRRNTIDNSSSSRNNPPPLYTAPPLTNEQQSSTVILSQHDRTQPHVQPHVPDGVNDDEVTNLQRTLVKTQMERDRINKDKQLLERHLSEYEDQLAASRVEHKRPQTGLVMSPDNGITQLESQLRYERIQLNDVRKEKEKLETEHTIRLEEANKQKEDVSRQLAEAKNKLTEVQSQNSQKDGKLAEVDKYKLITIQNQNLEKELKETKDLLDKANIDIHFKEKHLEKHNADLLGSHKEQEERMKAEMEHLQKEKEMTENNLVVLQNKITDVDELRKEIETLRADVRLKDKTLEQQKEQYGKQLEETKNENERLRVDVRTMEETLEEQKEQHETLLQQAREETETMVVVDNEENSSPPLSSQSMDGAGASSLSEKDKEMAKVIEQLMEREDEVTELKKQLQLKTTEATTFEEKKHQLEQALTHMVDGTAVMAEKTEMDKERQELEAERRYYKTLEAKTVTQQGEIEHLKQKLLHHAIDKQGGDSVTDLKQKLEEKETKIRQLSKESAEKSTICDRTYIALQESTQKFENACKERDDNIAELKKEIEQWKEAGKTTAVTLKQAMETMKIESERIVDEDKKELTELHHRNKEHELVIEELSAKCIRMNKELVQANDDVKAREQTLKELIDKAEQTKRELQELQQEHALLGRRMKKILETTDETSRELNIKQRLNDHKVKEIKQLKEDLSVAKEQIVIFNEELTKTLKEQKRAKEVINQLQTELEKNKQVLKKSGKKSFDEMRRSLDETKQTLEEERTATLQEKTATEQQVRAYKRQVDGLNEQLTEIKEKNEGLQKSLNTKSGLETENIDLQQQIHLHTSLFHEKVMRESELVNELEKMNKGNKVLKEKNNTISRELENTEEAHRIFQGKLVTEQDNHRNTHAAMSREMENMRIAMTIDMENMRNANMILQQRLKDAWVQVDQLQDELCSLKIKSENKSASTLDHGVPEPASNQQYDRRASENVNIYESSTYHSPNHLGGKMQRPNTDFQSQSNRTESSSRGRSIVPPAHPARGREQLADDIKENPILHNIDKEIEYVAAEVRRQTLLPQTQEFFDDDNDDPSLGPYDPNLTCPNCGMRYRYGEIQKLRRHINEFCVARQYTQPQGHN